MIDVNNFPDWVKERFYIFEDEYTLLIDDQVSINKESIVKGIEVLDSFTIYTKACGIRLKRHPKHILTVITE